MAILGKIARSTLAYANETQDWRIYQDFAHVLIHHARELYSKDSFGVTLQETVYALDSTIIDLCLALFPWAKFRTHKDAIKMHTLPTVKQEISRFPNKERTDMPGLLLGLRWRPALYCLTLR